MAERGEVHVDTEFHVEEQNYASCNMTKKIATSRDPCNVPLENISFVYTDAHGAILYAPVVPFTEEPRLS